VLISQDQYIEGRHLAMEDALDQLLIGLIAAPLRQLPDSRRSQ
jgi:hypothetical protein